MYYTCIVYIVYTIHNVYTCSCSCPQMQFVQLLQSLSLLSPFSCNVHISLRDPSLCDRWQNMCWICPCLTSVTYMSITWRRWCFLLLEQFGLSATDCITQMYIWPMPHVIFVNMWQVSHKCVCIWPMPHICWCMTSVTYMLICDKCHIYVDMWPESENLKALVLPLAGAASLFFPYTGCHSGRPCDCKIWRTMTFKNKIHTNIMT